MLMHSAHSSRLQPDLTADHHRSPLDALVRSTSSENRAPQRLHISPPSLSPSPPNRVSSSSPIPSPLLHTKFRSSVATALDDLNSTDSPYAVDEYNHTHSLDTLSDFNVSPQVIVRSPSISASSSRAPVQYNTPQSTNFSRPQPPRTLESERAKQQVLHRMKYSKSLENVSLADSRYYEHPRPAPQSPSPYHNPATTSQTTLSVSTLSPNRSPQQVHFMVAQQMSYLPPGPSPGGSSHTSSPSYFPSHFQNQSQHLRGAKSSSSTLSTTSNNGASPIEARSPSQYTSSSNHSQSQSDYHYPLTPQSNISQLPSEELTVAINHGEPYDRYSFYELPSPSSSPTFLKPPSPSQAQAFKSSISPATSTSSLTERVDDSPREVQSAEDYLMLGIATHLIESPSSLKQSAQYFQASATFEGGCPFGMLMWGLCLRHGWGVASDERKAFAWLRKACEIAIGDFEGLDPEKLKVVDGLKNSNPNSSRGEGRRNHLSQSTKGSRQEVKSELVLAIYEVGQSFFQGWGVPRDRIMGFNYFLMAARLGDIDAQQELGYCYSNGKGCKKDRKEAAKWYRAAAEQGASTVGLAWIYKEKFQ